MGYKVNLPGMPDGGRHILSGSICPSFYSKTTTFDFEYMIERNESIAAKDMQGIVLPFGGKTELLS